MFELIPRERRTIAPGVLHVPDWLDPDAQRRLVAAAQEWAAEGPGARHAVLPGGARMTVSSVCLGWHWIPCRYSRTRDDQDGSPVQPFPSWLADLGARAMADAYGSSPIDYRPDVALVNSYRGDARLGMHQDREERASDPVVSLSLGTACVFRIGSPHHRRGPWHDVELRSGDLVVFGGEHRLAYHRITKLLPDRDVPDIGVAPGERINLTLRVSGLA